VACGADVQGIVLEMAQADAAKEQGHSAGGAQQGPRRGKTGKGKLLTFLRSDSCKTRLVIQSNFTNQPNSWPIRHVTTLMLLTCGPNW